MTLLIPMAGEGKRFKDKGYKYPKPLIEVSGKPMIIQAANALPKANHYAFVCRQEHVEEYSLDNLLKSNYPNCHIISINYLTEGQASSCLLAEGIIDSECQLLIGPCDNGMIWDRSRFQSMVNDTDNDTLIWTFRNNVTVKRNPQMYGWVAVDEKENAKKVSCKIPISDDPVHDHAIVGTFWFRKANYFFDYTKKMIAKNRRINNEFYVDELMNELIENGLSVKVFEIDKYICWGTPDDLKTYQYWESYFKNREF